MSNPTLLKECHDLGETGSSVETSLLTVLMRNSIWALGIPSWLFGVTDRSVAALADGYLSPIEILHILTISFLFFGWLCLKPENSLYDESSLSLHSAEQHEGQYSATYLQAGRSRMAELQEQHLISQGYVLPFPYLCQIYHLLNLKHLEDVHGFSLNHLKVVSVSQFQPTQIGGKLKFQTMLDSPLNPLRVWRQSHVEVDLILHSPYTVELRVPIYNDKKIVVVFNALPLSQTEHKLFIDIYSDLNWPKPLLQFIMHLAAGLTLFEDLPYLRKLAEKNLERIVGRQRVSSHETMRLFKRFVDLYGSDIQTQSALLPMPAEPLSAKVS